MEKVTHGFPQNPSPMFFSHKFKIENRPGLEDQDVQDVLRILADLKAPITSENARKNEHLVHELAKFLSDWHLLAFLETIQLFSEVSFS